MNTNAYKMTPSGVASLLHVRTPFVGASLACVYMSKERGVLVGRFERPLSDMGWPAEVQAQINRHFETVFALEHETWKGTEPSPRAVYCDNAVPWTVEVGA